MTSSSGLYVHIPFCSKRCGYCDFFAVKIAGLKSVDVMLEKFSDALITEIGMWKNTVQNTMFSSLFFGGGTPSLLPPHLMRKIMKSIRNTFQFETNPEFSIETNPESLDKKKLETYLDLEIKRISMGIQTFNDETLNALGRGTTVAEIFNKYELIRKLGFDNINLDLMFGLIHDPVSQHEKNLDFLIQMNPEHISAYCLTLNASRLSAEIRSGKLKTRPDEQLSDEYERTTEKLTLAGYNCYEISNFAKPGFECRHNSIYWMQENYLGLGPSACGSWNGLRYKNIPSVPKYMKALFAGNRPVQTQEVVSKENLQTEAIFLSLRLSKGLDLNILTSLQRKKLNEKLPLYQELQLIKSSVKSNQLILTPKGRFLMDEIILDLI